MTEEMTSESTTPNRDEFMRDLGGKPFETWTVPEIKRLYFIALAMKNADPQDVAQARSHSKGNGISAPAESAPLSEEQIDAILHRHREPKPPHTVDRRRTTDNEIIALCNLALRGLQDSRGAVLAFIRKEFAADDNGEPVGALPPPGWETGYCAGIRSIYLALKETAIKEAK